VNIAILSKSSARIPTWIERAAKVQSASGILPEDQTLIKQATLIVAVKDATLTVRMLPSRGSATILAIELID
jgi:hypothetical protein